MAEQAGAPPVRAYTFCDKHGDLTASVATIAAQTEAQTAILRDFKDETRRTIQDTLDRIDKHCVMEGHPLMVARLAGYDRVQKEQIEVLQGLQARLEDHGTRLHDVESKVAAQGAEKQLVWDRSTKLAVAWVTGLVALVSGGMASAAAVYAARLTIGH